MLNAKEAWKLTEDAIIKQIETRKDRAQEFCNELDEEIKKTCDNGECSITVMDIPEDLNSEVIGICKDNGYSVTPLNSKTFVLIW